MNHYRALEHLDPVRLNEGDSQAAAAHARYIVENKLGPGDFSLVGNQVKHQLASSVHEEQVGNRWYSINGASVVARCDVFTASAISSQVATWIDRLMTSPLSVLVILEPTLVTVGYGDYCANGSCAGVVVYDYDQSQQELNRSFKRTAANYNYDPYDPDRGLGDSARMYLRSPILFPPPASAFLLGSYDGGREYDNPIAPCAGYRVPTGLPIVLSLGESMNDAAGVKLDSYSLMDGDQLLETCAYDASSYTNPDERVQEIGRRMLAKKLAAVLIPRAPLKPGRTYTVAIAVDSTTYRWSFKIGQPPR
ncbi:MAG TPA: hypothetical protein VMA09_15560 [Candidatus Binataceae bacterium]|nr:hypothetical protein [Candidatus Binataceae bacterium]